MKSIKVKSYNKLMENIIAEDGIKLDGNTSSWNGKLQKRIVDAIRLANECKKAAEIARQNGNDEDATWLDQRATDYEEAAAHWNQDVINDDDEEEQAGNVDSNKDKKEATATDRAAQAASDANYAAAQANNAAKDAQQKADEQAANGQDNSEAQKAADQAKEAAEKAKEAAEQAKEAAENAQKAEKQGNKDTAESEANKAEEAAKDAEEAAEQANEAAGTKDNSKENNGTAPKDTRDNTDTSTDDAQGGPKSQSQSKDDQNNDSGSKNNNGEGEESGSAENDESEGSEGSDSEESDKENSDKQNSKNSNGKGSNSDNSDESEEDDEDADGNDSGKSGSGDDDESEDGEDDSDAPVKDPFADDEDIPQLNMDGPDGKEPRDATLDDIIKQLSGLEGEAKRGAIDGLTDLVSGKKNESLHEDLEIDKVKAIAKKYGVELKYHQGAFGLDYEICIDSRDKENYKNCYDELQAMNPTKLEKTPGSIIVSWAKERKVSYFFEAFKKGLRDFSDEEWDDMSDETIERIEKVKQIDTIDNVDDIKADFKDWSENPVLRQELEDEEKQNIQQDILQRRENEKEIEKYSKLETLKDFELDFESCIRDQVTMVMKDYQDYSEINPEYEDEDIIMKADVQKIIPSEELPSIAIFFDQSSSWDSRDIAKGQKAIATVKQKYVDTGLCTLDIWYFADRVGKTTYGIGGGTTAWPYIVATIRSYDYKNVIIMTDDDMNEWNNHGESYTVEGCVWWIWRDGRRAPNLPKQVKGMQHNFECEFH